MLNLKGKKVLITGADGFIGSHLTERLIEEGADVRALVYYNSWESLGLLSYVKKIENNCEIVKGDIRDPHFCLELVNGQEIVFHLAALIAIPYSYIAPTSFFETNVLGSVNLLQAARKNDRLERFIHTSTSETYGTALYVPIDEKHELQAQSPYAASKIGADKAAISFYNSFGLPVTVVRLFNNYGPRQSPRAVIPTILSQLMSKSIKKVKLGLLTPVRDYTFVKDTAEAFIKILATEKAVGEVFNVGTGEGYSIQQIYDILTDITGEKKEIQQDPQRLRPSSSEVFKLICDNRKIKRVTGWKPRTDFREGLKEAAEWVRDNSDFYNPERYSI